MCEYNLNDCNINRYITMEKNIDMLEECSEESVKWFSLEGFECKGKVVDIYDGDSLTLILPFRDEYFKFKCRLYGIDTAESCTKNLDEKNVGVDAKKFLEKMLLGEIVDVICNKFDKYGRLLVVVIYKDQNIVDLMVKNGFGYYYDGGKRKNFNKWYLRVL
jgi:micrococcal nuclease